MAKPKNKGEPHPFHVTLPQFHFDYLTLLATRSRLGVTENEVAQYILTRELDKMFRDGYHDKQLPKA